MESWQREPSWKYLAPGDVSRPQVLDHERLPTLPREEAQREHGFERLLVDVERVRLLLGGRAFAFELLVERLGEVGDADVLAEQRPGEMRPRATTVYALWQGSVQNLDGFTASEGLAGGLGKVRSDGFRALEASAMDQGTNCGLFRPIRDLGVKRTGSFEKSHNTLAEVDSLQKPVRADGQVGNEVRMKKVSRLSEGYVVRPARSRS